MFGQSEGWIGDGGNRGPFSKCAAGHVAAKVKKGEFLPSGSAAGNLVSMSDAEMHASGLLCSPTGHLLQKQ